MTHLPNQVGIRKISESDLYISEPKPALFGNESNDSNNSNWTNRNWLKSRFHFSFAEWTTGRSNLGCLRVVNDDLVQPLRGFGAHGHRDMEILTYVLKGGLTHQDSMGTQETLHRGSVQFMTAGTGVQHSEKNLNDEQELRFIQSWIMPRKQGLKPHYGSFVGRHLIESHLNNQWFHLVSDKGQSGKVQINQDCNLFVSQIDAQNRLVFDFLPERQGYVVCLEGSVRVDNLFLDKHEASEIRFGNEQTQVTFCGLEGHEKTHILLYEMAD